MYISTQDTSARVTAARRGVNDATLALTIESNSRGTTHHWGVQATHVGRA